MLNCPTQVPIFLYATPIDLRKSFDGLLGVIEAAFGRESLEGHLFLFVNQRRDKLKALWWEPGGLVIWYKRLEEGTLELPPAVQGQSHISMDATELAMLIAGVPLAHAKRRRKRRAAA